MILHQDVPERFCSSLVCSASAWGFGVVKSFMNRARHARKRPGKATIPKACRQPQCSAMKAPSRRPTGAPISILHCMAARALERQRSGKLAARRLCPAELYPASPVPMKNRAMRRWAKARAVLASSNAWEEDSASKDKPVPQLKQEQYNPFIQ